MNARADSGVRTLCGVEPNTISPPFCRISEIPRVTINWPKAPWSSRAAVVSPDTRDSRKRCSNAPPPNSTGPASIAATKGATIGPEDPERGEPADKIDADIHAQHQQLALREVDDLHDAEDQAEADAHQSVDAADDEPAATAFSTFSTNPLPPGRVARDPLPCYSGCIRFSPSTTSRGPGGPDVAACPHATTPRHHAPRPRRTPPPALPARRGPPRDR